MVITNVANYDGGLDEYSHSIDCLIYTTICIIIPIRTYAFKGIDIVSPYTNLFLLSQIFEVKNVKFRHQNKLFLQFYNVELHFVANFCFFSKKKQ